MLGTKNTRHAKSHNFDKMRRIRNWENNGQTVLQQHIRNSASLSKANTYSTHQLARHETVRFYLFACIMIAKS